MQKTTGLIEKYHNKLSGKQWYHQRFDGSPMFIFAIAEAETKKEKRKPKDTEPDIRVCFFGKGKADWYLELGDITKGSDAIIKLAKKDPNVSKKLLKAWKKDEKKFEDFFLKKFPKIDLNKLTEKQLVKLWHDSYHLFIDRTTSTAIIDHFALGSDDIIGSMLRKEIFAKPQVNFRESQFTEIFSTATAPVHQSFTNIAEIDLLKIILNKSKETLANYQKRYFWTKNNYVTAQVLPLGFFEEEISYWKQSGKNLSKELTRIQNIPKYNKLKKQALLKKYKLSPLLKTLLKVSEDFTWWQDERKKATYFNIHIGCAILSEVAKRTGYKLNELKYATPSEIKDVINLQSPSRIELQKRANKSGLVVVENKFEIITDEKAIRLKQLMLGDKKKMKRVDFRGLSASTGKATGTVKIIRSATEVNKVNPGDILVAVMTRPDYIQAMKKAAAIVTNEGGITSHAAIISRELGIPCIIGTKIATEVLRDGDIVEVNADHGVVRKIK